MNEVETVQPKEKQLSGAKLVEGKKQVICNLSDKLLAAYINRYKRNLSDNDFKHMHRLWQAGLDFALLEQTRRAAPPQVQPKITTPDVEKIEIETVFLQGRPFIVGKNIPFTQTYFFSLSPGDIVSQIGDVNKNGKYTSTHRCMAFSPPITYVGKLKYKVNQQTPANEYACFEIPNEAIKDGELKPGYKLYQLMLRNGNDVIIQDYRGLRIDIFKAVFKWEGASAKLKTPTTPVDLNNLMPDDTPSQSFITTPDAVAHEDTPIGPTQPELTTGTAEESKSYPGNKYGNDAYKHIINQLPPHKNFISGFLGNCAVLREKKMAKLNAGFEINPDTIEQYWGTPPKGMTIYINDFLQHVVRSRTSELYQNKKSLLYLDPPYLLTERRNHKDIYEFELSDKQHIELLDWCVKQKCMIAISHYPNKLYDKILKGWRKITYNVITRGGVMTDALYMNYPEPEQLHEYTWLGKDRTERQQIKRKIDREIKRLKRMPAKERNAIIEAINKQKI